MNTEKKNQHYIPKFYLRNFSINNNGKQIGIFNINSSFYYPTSPIKTQGSKKFLYGFDGKTEDWLSNLEGDLAQVIKRVCEGQKIPIHKSDEHIDLLAFVAITYLRNPVLINHAIYRSQSLKKITIEIYPDANNLDEFEVIDHNNAVDISLSSIQTIIENIIDLKCKIIKNQTTIPFITSNFPIIKCNNFLLSKKWKFAKTGYGTVGLIIIVPLTPQFALIFYDSEIYKVGNKKQDCINLYNEREITELNKFQIINCIDTLFFNQEIDEMYIQNLLRLTRHIPKANIPSNDVQGKQNTTTGESENRESFIHFKISEINLEIKFHGLKYSSKSIGYKFQPSVAQMRKHPASLRDNG